MPEPDSQPTALPLPWIKTPLVESLALSKEAGCRIFLKLENLQPSGSFKSRGIGNLVLQSIKRAPPSAPLHFYSSSGGNAGLACVTAATALGYKSTVVVPLSTSTMMKGKLLKAGATNVVQYGASWKEADDYLRDHVLSLDKDGVYVPPFDHQDVWDGAATLVTEIEEQLAAVAAAAAADDDDDDNVAPAAIVCSVGGAGLFCGIAQGISSSRALSSSSTSIIAVETAGAESLHVSVRSGRLETLPGITSIAYSLGAKQVAPKALEYALASSSSPAVHSVVVSDAEAVQACLRFADEERIVVEPACGASLALVFFADKLHAILPRLQKTDKVVIIVCGGSNISLELLETYRIQYA